MNRIFSGGSFARIADGTLLAGLLNPLDDNSGLPADLFADFSIAVGLLEPASTSKIHLMPLVTQVTFVLRGAVEIRMKDKHEDAPYSLYPVPMQAVLTRPGTFIQYINHSEQACQVLYIVSPSYLHKTAADGAPCYDDALITEQSWQDLADANWALGNALSMQKQRAAALKRIE